MMHCLDLTLESPAANLALDEALLDVCEESGAEVLRFWESPEYFVVVGYANKAETEVNVPACRERSVPILRRCSGGGTVLQGPGCLNYSLVLNFETEPKLQTIPGANCFIMRRNAQALQEAL
ncbi:MAG: lplA, partial [Verrucomicrobiales bacterium]|nr:lplA [Verrucomicrobiales bacterium]